ncbi:phasin [Rhodopseudomonas palustris]|uniref:Phasin n=1 Tax=Rhodopseudomonas palustris TaxID=1076 RepID=A0AAX3DY21_RHOPL|nr:phasin [Rhodopseudomonas palustris]UYO39045.1 phasin [Rhodopseudomonas palustris]UYO48404.1 phasin [Rhodopseudomonas palustris]
MDQEERDRFEIPKEVRSMAEAGFDQARKAFEHMLSSAQQTAATIEDRGAAARANAKEITGRAVSFAERNVHAALDYAQQLVHAKDLGDVMRVHTEYVQSQMKALAEQASELGQVVTKAAQDVAKPKS